MNKCVLKMRDLDGNVYEIWENPGAIYDDGGHKRSYSNGFLEGFWFQYRFKDVEDIIKKSGDIKYPNNKIVSIEILDGVKKLGSGFSIGTNLKGVVIPPSLTEFEESAFGSMYTLDYVLIENNPIAEKYIKKNYPDVKIIKDRSSYNYLIKNLEPQKSLEFEVTLTNGETKKAILEPNEFSIGMETWKMLWIQDVKKVFQKMGLGDSDCAQIKTFKIPEGIRALSTALLWDTKNLENLILPESLNSINNLVVAGTKIESLTLPDNLRFDLNKETSPFYSQNNQLKHVKVKRDSLAEKYIRAHHQGVNISYKDDIEKKCQDENLNNEFWTQLKTKIKDNKDNEDNQETGWVYIVNPPVLNLPVKQKPLRSYSEAFNVLSILLLILVTPVGVTLLVLKFYDVYNYNKRIQEEKKGLLLENGPKRTRIPDKFNSAVKHEAQGENKELLLEYESESKTTSESQNGKSVQTLKDIETLKNGLKRTRIPDEFNSAVKHKARG